MGLAVDDIKGILKAAVLKRLALQVGLVTTIYTVYCIIKLMNNNVIILVLAWVKIECFIIFLYFHFLLNNVFSYTLTL